MFQEIFNDIWNVLIQWVLISKIVLWKFRSPLGFQLPMWEFTWECGGSFPHILLHSWKHEMWLLGSLLAHTFASLCIGCDNIYFSFKKLVTTFSFSSLRVVFKVLLGLNLTNEKKSLDMVLPFYFHLNLAQIIYLVALTSFMSWILLLRFITFIVVPHYVMVFVGLLCLFKFVLQLCFFSPKNRQFCVCKYFKKKLWPSSTLWKMSHLLVGQAKCFHFFSFASSKWWTFIFQNECLGVASIRSTTQGSRRWYDLTPSPFVAYWRSWLDLPQGKLLGM